MLKSVARLAAFLMFLAVSDIAFADASDVAENWRDGGNIQLFEENPDISMNKEVIAVHRGYGSSTFNVFYELQNQSRIDRAIEIGFPIKVTASYAYPVRTASDRGSVSALNGTFLTFLWVLGAVTNHEGNDVAEVERYINDRILITQVGRDTNIELSFPEGLFDQLPWHNAWSVSELRAIAESQLSVPDVFENAARAPGVGMPLTIYEVLSQILANSTTHYHVRYDDPADYYSYRDRLEEVQVFDLYPGRNWRGAIGEFTLLGDFPDPHDSITADGTSFFDFTLAGGSLSPVDRAAGPMHAFFTLDLEPEGDLLWEERSTSSIDYRDMEMPVVDGTVRADMPAIPVMAGIYALGACLKNRAAAWRQSAHKPADRLNWSFRRKRKPVG